MKCEAVHCVETGTVRFAIYPDGFDGPRILARISDDALAELFAAGRDDDETLIDACRMHFDLIEASALERHRAAPAKAVMLDAADFVCAVSFADALHGISIGPNPAATQK